MYFIHIKQIIKVILSNSSKAKQSISQERHIITTRLAEQTLGLVTLRKTQDRETLICAKTPKVIVKICQTMMKKDLVISLPEIMEQ